MVSFREARRYRPEGFHAHHLIPIEVNSMQSLAITIGATRAAGFDPNDFRSNGMFLPAIEKNAACFRLPLHRGPHPTYNRLVADRIAELRQLPPIQLPQALNALQSALRVALRTDQNGLSDVTECKLRTSPDFRKIDGHIDILWSATSQ